MNYKSDSNCNCPQSLPLGNENGAMVDFHGNSVNKNTGHGHFDMAAYDKYLADELNDFYYREAGINASLAGWLLLPRLPQDRLRLVILFLAVKVTAG